MPLFKASAHALERVTPGTDPCTQDEKDQLEMAVLLKPFQSYASVCALMPAMHLAVAQRYTAEWWRLHMPSVWTKLANLAFAGCVQVGLSRKAASDS